MQELFENIKNSPALFTLFTAILWGAGGFILNLFRDSKIEKLKKSLNENSEIFRKRLDIFQNFIKKEFLQNQIKLTEEQRLSLEYYWEIGLISDIETLRSVVESILNKDTDEEDEKDIEKLSRVFLSMRKELHKDKETIIDKDVIDNYCKVLLQIGAREPTATMAPKAIALSQNKNMKQSLSKDRVKYFRLSELLSLRHGTTIDRKFIVEWSDFLYIKPKDIKSTTELELNLISLGDIDGFQNKILENINTIFLVSRAWTVWKTCFLRNISDKKIIVSSNLFYSTDIKDNILHGEFLAVIFKTKFVSDQVNEKKRWVAQQFITLKDLLDIYIPLPSLEIQREFASFKSEEGLLEQLKEFEVNLKPIN